MPKQKQSTKQIKASSGPKGPPNTGPLKKAPVAQTRVLSNRPPTISRSGDQTFIEHKELLATISNSSTYVVNGGIGGNLYRNNPTNASLFSWLSTIAASFDKYKFISVGLSYEPFCATSEAGRVALYWDPDSQDLEPADRVELANHYHVKESAPWVGIGVSAQVDTNLRFTNDSSVSDTKLVDLGQFGWAVYGGNTSNDLGDIFVVYKVQLCMPQPSATLIQTVQSGGGGVSLGPGFASVSTTTATTTILTFRTPGVFIVASSQRSLTYTSTVGGGGLTVNSSTVQQGTSAYLSILNVTVTKPGGTLTATGTGFGNYTFEVVRAKVGNSANTL